MHFGGLPQKVIDDLTLVFLHAHGGQSSKSNGTVFQALMDLIDNLTSNLSTFPYTAAQCEKFLDLFKMSRGKPYYLSKKKTGKMF